jgi:exopolyphosphatase/guanosine-5'-triphosphate,3'-diphosphate pyrophosphatase
MKITSLKISTRNILIYTLYVGGGSTELTFFADGKLRYKESFNIGTIRLLKNMVTETTWEEMRDILRITPKANCRWSRLVQVAISIKFFP